SGSLSYGPPVRLRLLSTSPHGDAVTFDYEVMACLDADLHRADVMPSRAHGLRPPPERRRSVAHRHEKAARFEFVETQLHRRPGVGRDPGKKRDAPCAHMPGLRPPPERRRWGSHRREKLCALDLERLKYLVAPA